MLNGIPQLICDFCGEPHDKPWYALISICSEPNNADFSWELCERCYQQIKQAIIGVMQQNLRTETAKLKQQVAGLKI